MSKVTIDTVDEASFPAHPAVHLPSCCASSPGGCSKAVLWLGQLKLSCSEEQMTALVELLTNSLAFGAMSSWDTDVFIEIGVLAGLCRVCVCARTAFSDKMHYSLQSRSLHCKICCSKSLKLY